MIEKRLYRISIIQLIAKLESNAIQGLSASEAVKRIAKYGSNAKDAPEDVVFDAINECKEAGINVPIIPGIKPITTKSQATILPTIFHIDLPEELADEVEKCKDSVAVKQVGIEWAIQQSKELMKFGVPTLHFYSMGKSDPIYGIAKELF